MAFVFHPEHHGPKRRMERFANAVCTALHGGLVTTVLLALAMAAAGCGRDERRKAQIRSTPYPEPLEPTSLAERGAENSAVVVDSASPPPKPPLDPVNSDWCTEGLVPMDEETCYFAPRFRGETPPLVVYLHGVIAPKGQTQRFVQQVMREAAEAHSAVVLFPRGKRGLGPKEVRDYFAWPTEPGSYARHAKAMIAGFLSHREALSGALGQRFGKTYVVGSSSGAYFASLLLLRGDFPADAYGLLSGGAISDGHLVNAARPNVFVAFGTGDAEKKGPETFARALSRWGFPVSTFTLAAGHGLRAEYVARMFAEWGLRHGPP